MAKEKRLGRGLSSLMERFTGGTDSEQDGFNTDAVTTTAVTNSSNTVDIMSIVPNPFQPRQEFDETEIEQLAQNIAANGLLQPIVVRQIEDKYQIIAGERRYRAALRAGWNEIPAHILPADDRQMLEFALAENLQRKDLNAIEKASSFAKYLELYGGTHEELAKRLQLDRSTVTNLLRLLDLPPELQDAVKRELLATGHVRALLPLEQYEQIEIAAKIQSEGWSVRQTEKFVQDLIRTGEAADPKNKEWKVVSPDGETRTVSKKSENILRLEQDFRHQLGGVKVQLTQQNEKGKGKLVISFANHGEFEQIYSAICKVSRAAG